MEREDMEEGRLEEPLLAQDQEEEEEEEEEVPVPRGGPVTEASERPCDNHTDFARIGELCYPCGGVCCCCGKELVACIALIIVTFLLNLSLISGFPYECYPNGIEANVHLHPLVPVMGLVLTPALLFAGGWLKANMTPCFDGCPGLLKCALVPGFLLEVFVLSAIVNTMFSCQD